MLRFITKAETFAALDAGLHDRLGWAAGSIHLKTWQDLAVFRAVGETRDARIAEIGGGDSRILPRLAAANRCTNIERFEGQDGGPQGPVEIPGVAVVRAFVGEFSPELPDGAFDLVFSVSVIEHVPNEALAAFLDDHLRILRPGGRAIHAIDLYVGTEPPAWSQARLEAYRRWLDDPRLEPLAPPEAREARFDTGMAANPDLTMWHWSRAVPALRALRETCQCAALLLGFRRRG